jgi:ubiquinone/menaquinone biosynthesis C-methylase UbiE
MPPKAVVERPAELATPSIAGGIDANGIIALIPMRPHDIIGDIRCGRGELTLPLARYACWGKVYAVDADQDALGAVASKAQQSRIGNVETVQAKESSVPLEDASLDGALLAGVLGEASRPKSVLKEAFRLLKKGGWVAVIEWAKVDAKERAGGSQSGQRRSGDDVAEAAAEIGFKRVSLRPLNGNRYLLVLRK